LLFDRGATTATTPANANNMLIPGFNFNNVGLPNVNNEARSTIGSQGIASLGVGRAGFFGGPTSAGGLVLSAASDSVNMLLRALEQEGRAQILSRPQVMALNNQPAFVQVGQDISRITGTTLNANSTQQNVEDVPTGLILSIQPRINDDGVIVMTVDADKSELGSEADGTQIGTTSGPNGVSQPLIAKPINRTTAQTTISAKSGQTVVIGGLITSSDEITSRGVPYLRDIPWVGQLFNFEAQRHQRKELLIILTPYIISEDDDYEMIKMLESQRMNWCLGDVVSIDGDRGLQGASCLFCSDDVPVLFPDNDPTATQFATGGHQHSHEAPQPTPISLPNEQAQGLQRSGLGQQPNLQSLPQQTINAGYYQNGQPTYQGDPRHAATPAAYVPSQQQTSVSPNNQQPQTELKRSWFPFSRKASSN